MTTWRQFAFHWFSKLFLLLNNCPSRVSSDLAELIYGCPSRTTQEASYYKDLAAWATQTDRLDVQVGQTTPKTSPVQWSSFHGVTSLWPIPHKEDSTKIPKAFHNRGELSFAEGILSFNKDVQPHPISHCKYESVKMGAIQKCCQLLTEWNDEEFQSNH